MDVEIDHGGARDAVFALGVARGNGGIVEEAKAHRLVDLGMMAGRPHRHEGVVDARPTSTASVAATAPPTPRITASQVPGDIEVSPSI